MSKKKYVFNEQAREDRVERQLDREAHAQAATAIDEALRVGATRVPYTYRVFDQIRKYGTHVLAANGIVVERRGNEILVARQR